MAIRRRFLASGVALAAILIAALFYHFDHASQRISEADATVAEFGGSIGRTREGGLSANLCTVAITDKEIALLAPLSGLRMIDLRYSQLSDAGLSALVGLTNVADINLGHTRIDGSGLAHLESLSRLEGLEMAHTAVDDKSLEHLRPLTSLRRLDLCHTRVTAAGLAELKALKRLQYLAVSPELIKDAEATLKPGLPRLQVQDDQFDMAGGPIWTVSNGRPQLRNAKRLVRPVKVVKSASLLDGGTFTMYLQGADGALLAVCISAPDIFDTRAHVRVYQGGIAAGDPSARLVPLAGPERDWLFDALVDAVSHPLPEPDGNVEVKGNISAAWWVLDKLCEDCKNAGTPCPGLPQRQPRQR